MTLTNLYRELPLLAFIIVLIYTYLGIVRFKRLFKIHWIIVIFVIFSSPVIILILPVFAAFELTMQIMKLLNPLFK